MRIVRTTAASLGLATVLGTAAAAPASAENPFNPPGQVCVTWRSNVSVLVNYTDRHPGVDKHAVHYARVQRGTCTTGWWDVNGFKVPSSRTDVVVYLRGFKQAPGWHTVHVGVTDDLTTAWR